MRRLGIGLVILTGFLMVSQAADARSGRGEDSRRVRGYVEKRYAHKYKRHPRRFRRGPRLAVHPSIWFGPAFMYPLWYRPPVVHTYPVYPPAAEYRPAGGPCGAYVYRNDREVLGALIGGIGGAALGYQIGSGNGRALSVFAGSVLGTVVGAHIGRDLDEAQRLRLSTTTQYALENQRSGTLTVWDDSGADVCGVVVPRPAFKNERDQYCREFQQTIVVGGKKQEAYGTACRQPDGQWKIVN